jgi:hypothetical protein
VRVEGTQLVEEFALPLVILVFAARCFTRIYESALGGYVGEGQGTKIDNGGGRDKELVNSTKSPLSPNIPSQ